MLEHRVYYYSLSISAINHRRLKPWLSITNHILYLRRYATLLKMMKVANSSRHMVSLVGLSARQNSTFTDSLGMLDLGCTSYLISISQREQVAQIREKPVYTITGVTLIPLSSRTDAANAISQANKSLKQGKTTEVEGSETDDEDDTHSVTQTDEEQDVPGSPTDAPATLDVQKGINQLKNSTSVVADVIKDKGKYGRFAERWFSKGGWQASANRQPSMSPEDDLTREQKRQGIDALPEDSKADEAPAPTEEEKAADVNVETKEASAEELAHSPPSPSQTVLKSLTPRILRTAKLYFASRSFFFSYDYDISHSMSKQDSRSSPLPLFKRFDPLVSYTLTCSTNSTDRCSSSGTKV